MSKIGLLSLSSYDMDGKKRIRQAIDLVDGIERVVESGDLVLIKPNLVKACNGRSGTVTHSIFVEALIELCHEAGAEKIFVGDGSGEVVTPQAFRVSGMMDVIRGLNSRRVPVVFVDLNYDKNPDKNEYDAVSLGDCSLNLDQTYRIAHTVSIADAIISVPKLKSHPRTGITISLKNVVGIAPSGYYGFPKWRGRIEVLPHGPKDQVSVKDPMQKNEAIWRTILDLNRIMLGKYPGSPKERKYLAVVDGVVAGAYNGTVYTGEYWSPVWKPVKTGVIIAGTDPVAVDTVGAKVMCYLPEKIPLLVHGEETGSGSMKDIAVLGNRIEDIRTFVPPSDDWLDIVDTDIPKVNLMSYYLRFRRSLYQVASNPSISSLIKKARINEFVRRRKGE